MMAGVLTCIAVVAAIPALMADDDAVALSFGLNALGWSCFSMAAA